MQSATLTSSRLPREIRLLQAYTNLRDHGSIHLQSMRLSAILAVKGAPYQEYMRSPHAFEMNPHRVYTAPNFRCSSGMHEIST